jgi:hypothetical protein
MWPPTLTNNEPSLEEVWEWHLGLSEDLTTCQTLALKALDKKEDETIPSRLSGMNKNEICAYYEKQQIDLDLTTSFSLFAAFEAALRVDLEKRVLTKDKDSISIDLKTWRASLNISPRFANLISKWKAACCVSDFDKLDSVRDYRNWLAHGRFETPKGDCYKYSNPILVKKVLDSLMTCIKESVQSTYWKK